MGKPDGFLIDITVLIIQCYYLFVMFIYLCDTNVTERSYMIWVRAEQLQPIASRMTLRVRYVINAVPYDSLSKVSE